LFSQNKNHQGIAMYKTLSLLVITAFIAVECNPFGYYADDAANANAFVDSVLTAVKKSYSANLDPLHIPDITAFQFSKKVGIITLKGDAKLEEGTITGLSHLTRSGDSSLGTEGGHFAAKLQFGDNNIHAHFKLDAEFMGLKVKATLDTDIGNIDVKVNIGVGADGKPAITAFEIDKLQHVKIDVHGPIAPLDGVLDLLLDGFVEVFNPQVEKLLGGILKDFVGKELANFKLPGTF